MKNKASRHPHLQIDTKNGGRGNPALPTPTKSGHTYITMPEETQKPQKSQMYENGPQKFIEFLDIYREPKLEELAFYDLIINVAQEVPLPFREESYNIVEWTNTVEKYLDDEIKLVGNQETKNIQTINATYMSKSQPLRLKVNKLWYIHMPWDHNGDHNDEGLNDMENLCCKIGLYIKNKKKVLIHCAQGQCRSQYLLAMYLMYDRQHDLKGATSEIQQKLDQGELDFTRFQLEMGEWQKKTFEGRRKKP